MVAQSSIVLLLITFATLTVFVFFDRSPKRFASMLLRPLNRKSLARFSVEIRFVLVGTTPKYVQIYKSGTSWFWSAQLLEAIHRHALRKAYPDIESKGRFESKITPHRHTLEMRFWNPNLVAFALSEKGRLVLRSETVQEVIPTDVDGDESVNVLRRRRRFGTVERNS